MIRGLGGCLGTGVVAIFPSSSSSPSGGLLHCCQVSCRLPVPSKSGHHNWNTMGGRSHLDQLRGSGNLGGHHLGSPGTGHDETPGVRRDGTMGEGDCRRAEYLEALGSGDGVSDGGERLECRPSRAQRLMEKLGRVALATVSLVAVNGDLELLRVGQVLHLTLKWVEILDIPTYNKNVNTTS